MAKMGRPKLKHAKKYAITLRVSKQELTEMKRKAKAANISFSEFVMRPHREAK